MKQLLLRLWKEEEGQDLTEYALLLVLLTLAAIGSLQPARDSDQRSFFEGNYEPDLNTSPAS